MFVEDNLNSIQCLWTRVLNLCRRIGSVSSADDDNLGYWSKFDLIQMLNSSYTLCKRSLGGFIGFILSICLSVHLSLVCGHDFVHACSEKWVQGFFWKFVHLLLTIWRCAPGIFILIWIIFLYFTCFFSSP